jgi:hypothetical protein
MIEIHQSVARRVMLKLFDTGTTTAATGKTVAVTISKDGAAFGNPSTGATNATERANGWYYVDLSTTDTNTLGDLVVRGTATGCDDSERVFAVVDSVRRGMTALPNAAAGANGGLPTVDASNRVKANTEQIAGQTANAAAAITFPTTIASTTNITAGTITTVTNLTNAPTNGDFTTTMKTSIANSAVASVTGNVGGNVTGSVGSIVDVWNHDTRSLTTFGTLLTDIVNGVWGAASRTLTAFGFTVSSSSDSNITAIKAKTDNLPADPAGLAALAAAHGSGAWTTATGFAVPGDAMSLTVPTGNALVNSITTAVSNQITTDHGNGSYLRNTEPPTTAEIADKYLGRNIAGGSDGGRTVKSTLQMIRNKVEINELTNVITVYAEDDVTVAWTGTVTPASSGSNGFKAIDPG